MTVSAKILTEWYPATISDMAPAQALETSIEDVNLSDGMLGLASHPHDGDYRRQNGRGKIVQRADRGKSRPDHCAIPGVRTQQYNDASQHASSSLESPLRPLCGSWVSSTSQTGEAKVWFEPKSNDAARFSNVGFLARLQKNVAK